MTMLLVVQDTTCSSVGPAYSTSYCTAAYKDVEFVGMLVNSSTPLPLANPSKMFLTSLQDPLNARAEMYVQLRAVPRQRDHRCLH